MKAFKPHAIFWGLLTLAVTGVVQAAMLGEIQVRSALGEAFNASISVAAAEDEDLSANCFRLVSPQDENAIGILRRAKLIYQYEAGGGRLLIRGEESSSEPVVTLGVRVKCPGEYERVFQRDYRVLLDPPEYKSGISLPVLNTHPTSNKTHSSRRKLPALGGTWLSEGGDSVAKIAASYYPRDKAKQQALVEGIYELNPELPQNTNARLGDDWRILLPMPPKPSAAPVVRAPRFDDFPAAAKNLEAMPRLTLGAELDNARVSADLPAEPTTTAKGEFRLRLSEANLDTEIKSTLTPEQTLQLRERLLSLESDDQAAQMLQLKYQIAELEKKLAGIQLNGPSNENDASLSSNDATGGLNFWPFLALLLLPLGFFAWRRWLRSPQQDELYTVISPSTAYLSAASRSRTSSKLHGHGSTLDEMDTQDFGTPIHREQNDDWHNSDMDVVSPGNVTEEAQLLLDHGLVPQAINLLNHEIEQMPAALALWMKLFEIFQRNGMSDAFQEKAVAFRLQFASDALWSNVQDLGRGLDPSNPLYQSLEMPSEVESSSPSEPHFAPSAEDRKFATALHVVAGLDVPEHLLERTENEQGRHLTARDAALTQPPEENVEELIYFSPSDIHEASSDTEEKVVDMPQQTRADDGDEVEIQIDAIQSLDELELKPSAPAIAVKATASPASFVSEDPALQEIAQLIESGQRKEAFKQLEEMLYKGSMSQRLTASKWLDKMLGTFGHG